MLKEKHLKWYYSIRSAGMIKQILYIIFLASVLTLHAQNPVPAKRKLPYTFKKDNELLGLMYREPYDKKREIVLENKRYRIYNNYLSVGYGRCYNSGWKAINVCTSFDYNFHVKKLCFQSGGMLVGPDVWSNTCIQFHMGWGYRMERCNYQLAAYGGLSFSDGYYLQKTDTSTYSVKMNTIGVYVALQAYYKVKFDYGIGLSTFFDANPKQMLAGIKLELFFSGAYKGLKKIDYSKEDSR